MIKWTPDAPPALPPPLSCILPVCLSFCFLLLPRRTKQCWGMNTLGALGLGDTLDRGDGADEMGDALPAVSLGTGVTVAPDTGAALPPTVPPTPVVSSDFPVGSSITLRSWFDSTLGLDPSLCLGLMFFMWDVFSRQNTHAHRLPRPTPPPCAPCFLPCCLLFSRRSRPPSSQCPRQHRSPPLRPMSMTPLLSPPPDPLRNPPRNPRRSRPLRQRRQRQQRRRQRRHRPQVDRKNPPPLHSFSVPVFV